MNKPNGYEETQAQGSFTPVELGGHYLVIKNVEEKKASNGRDMIVVYFDFAQEDAQAGYFAESFKNDIRPDKKWSNQATKYILVDDEEGKCSKDFKTFCTCVEHSNNGFKTLWGDNFCAQFKNKKIGGVFGEQMDYYNGEEKKKRVLRWFVSTDRVKDAEVPAISMTNAYKNRPTSNVPSGDGFMNVPDGIDEELPFN